ncbi:AAWKG family protein, partial [Streptomyces sp. NPDC046862]|uniref:AAWKG family protein n=1 Tax=Streptomyces sp. NPDC046862 TaxID=3154603 RepID=UPI003451880B
MADPKDNNDDNWRAAVSMLTGYPVPDRAEVFKDLTGNDGIPMIHVRLDKVGGPGWSSGFIGSGGWHTKNTDYTIPFYRPANDAKDVSAGTMLYMYRAHITFLASYQEAPPGGNDIIPDYTKTSTNLKDKGGWNKEGNDLDWNTRALTQYVYGSKEALGQLTAWPHSTHGFSNRGANVTDSAYVDLNSFTDSARAFDRAVKFFEDSAVTVGKWDTENIGEGSDSWDGTSAAIFKALIHKLARNYEGYADQLNGDNGDGSAGETALDGTVVKSEPARALIAAQNQLYEQAKNLEYAYNSWRPESNPQRWLYDMLEQARLEFLDQVDKTDFETIGGGMYSSAQIVVVAKEGFKNDVIIDGQSYGSPSDMATWKKVADEAVSRWGKSVQNFLGVAGAEAIVAIHKAFGDAQKAFDTKLTDKDKRSLSDISAKEEADKAKKEADAARAKAEADAAKAKAEAEAAAAAAKAQAEKDKAEAKAERDREKAEAEREKAEAKAQAEKDKAEAKAERDREKAEAEREKAEAK